VKIHALAVELFHADGRTDMTKLIVAIRNFANAPKKIGGGGHLPTSPPPLKFRLCCVASRYLLLDAWDSLARLGSSLIRGVQTHSKVIMPTGRYIKGALPLRLKRTNRWTDTTHHPYLRPLRAFYEGGEKLFFRLCGKIPAFRHLKHCG